MRRAAPKTAGKEHRRERKQAPDAQQQESKGGSASHRFWVEGDSAEKMRRRNWKALIKRNRYPPPLRTARAKHPAPKHPGRNALEFGIRKRPMPPHMTASSASRGFPVHNDSASARLFRSSPPAPPEQRSRQNAPPTHHARQSPIAVEPEPTTKRPDFGHETAFWHEKEAFGSPCGGRPRQKARSRFSDARLKGPIRARTRFGGQNRAVFAHASHHRPWENGREGAPVDHAAQTAPPRRLSARRRPERMGNRLLRADTHAARHRTRRPTCPKRGRHRPSARVKPGVRSPGRGTPDRFGPSPAADSLPIVQYSADRYRQGESLAQAIRLFATSSRPLGTGRARPMRLRGQRDRSPFVFSSNPAHFASNMEDPQSNRR